MNLIKLLRLNNGYTQEYVANVIGCCSDSYSRKEKECIPLQQRNF